MAEEADTSNANQASRKTIDPSAARRKHEALLERLSNRPKPSVSRNSDSDALESTQSFLALFSESKQSIESDLARCRQPTDPQSDRKSDLEKVSISISELEKLVAEKSYFLPPYDVRTCLKTISDLKQSVENVASEVVPKKRFAFRNKKAASTSVENDVVVVAETKTSEPEKPSFLVPDLPGFRDKENEVLVKELKGSEMGEFSITHLNSCEVKLVGSLRALFIHKLRNCKVYTGPVFGSILIEEVEDCVFVLASHQIRIHHAKRSDFYLRVRSNPIIEDCSGVRFAPYCLNYDGIEKDLQKSNLDEDSDSWANVDDFRWLKAVQSPNWCILPESERIDRVIASSSDK